MVWDKGLGEASHSVPGFAKPHGTPGGQEDTEVLSRECSAPGPPGPGPGQDSDSECLLWAFPTVGQNRLAACVRQKLSLSLP